MAWRRSPRPPPTCRSSGGRANRAAAAIVFSCQARGCRSSRSTSTLRPATCFGRVGLRVPIRRHRGCARRAGQRHARARASCWRVCRVPAGQDCAACGSGARSDRRGRKQPAARSAEGVRRLRRAALDLFRGILSSRSWRDTAMRRLRRRPTISRRRGPRSISRAHLRADGMPRARCPAPPRKAVPLQQSAPARPSKETSATRGRLPPRTIAGLAALPLDAAVLGHSQGPASRFADVRIADGADKQVPYLLERRDEPLGVDLTLASTASPQMPPLPPANGGSRSVYRIALPERRLPAGSLSVETSARVFQRSVQVGVVRPADRNSAGRVVRCSDVHDVAARRRAGGRSGAHAPARSDGCDRVVAGRRRRRQRAVATQPRATAAAVLSTAVLCPAGWDCGCSYGREDLQPPRYDLALLAPQLMGAAATEVTAGPESSRADADAVHFAALVLGLLLGAAVIVLLALIVRLAQNSDATTSSRPSALRP